ncbi:hypothetical protein PGB90_000035 [Kerria lacca]
MVIRCDTGQIYIDECNLDENKMETHFEIRNSEKDVNDLKTKNYEKITDSITRKRMKLTTTNKIRYVTKRRPQTKIIPKFPKFDQSTFITTLNEMIELQLKTMEEARKIMESAIEKKIVQKENRIEENIENNSLSDNSIKLINSSDHTRAVTIDEFEGRSAFYQAVSGEFPELRTADLYRRQENNIGMSLDQIRLFIAQLEAERKRSRGFTRFQRWGYQNVSNKNSTNTNENEKFSNKVSIPKYNSNNFRKVWGFHGKQFNRGNRGSGKQQPIAGAATARA